MAKGRPFEGWKLDGESREMLLPLHPPCYARLIADHVTLKGRPRPAADRAEVVGVADDGEGIQALVVAIDGSTDRPDGGTWHITWSMEPGRHAKESNQVIANDGWTARDPISITLIALP